MRDVMERTGLSRQAIHFYVEQGLVPPPVKTGETMGYYDEAHVERILLVKKLQQENFLPLKAIRAMLDDEGGEFTREQQQVLRDVKARLPSKTIEVDRRQVAVSELLKRTSLARRDIRELEQARLVHVERGTVSADDAWVIELWSEVRAAGFTRELGFEADVLQIFARGVGAMFDEEKQVLLKMAARLPAEKVAVLVERALPLIHSYLVKLHQTKVRDLFVQSEAV